MITLRTPSEVQTLRRANQLVAEILHIMAEAVAPGVTTGDLDAMAEERIRKDGAIPAFLGYRGYPSVTCISVDEEIVHGIPGKRRLEANQIVSIDVGVCVDGYYGDAAISVACGEVDADRAKLMAVTDRALANGIAAARAGNYLCDISCAIQQTCELEGLGIVRDFVGHGIGQAMHEEPQIPNFDTGQRGPQLRAGMVLALEPMVCMGAHEVKVLEDGWTAVTVDGKPSCHFEHSILITQDDAEILSRHPSRVWGQGGGSETIARPPTKG